MLQQKYSEPCRRAHLFNQFCWMQRAHYIGLGSNLGDRHGFIDSALRLMEACWGVRAVTSNRYQTPPWGMTEGTPDFINQVAAFQLDQSPRDVMNDLLRIEVDLGRLRGELQHGGAYQSRTIDLDLLAVDGVAMDTPELTLPHPRIPMRRFVLAPLAELAPQMRLEPGGRTVSEMLDACPDFAPLTRLDPIT